MNTTTVARTVDPDLFRRLSGLADSIFTVSTSANRLNSMEGLRGLAILMVFACHYYEVIWRAVPQTALTAALGEALMGAGGTGVDLFFVLSGFLIYGAVRKPGLRYETFLKRRAKRIYPAFLVVFVIYVLLFLVLPNSATTEVRDSGRVPIGAGAAGIYLLSNVLFLPGLFRIQPLMSAAWSLSYEWFFYLSLPIVAVVTRFISWRRSIRVAFMVSAIVLFVAGTIAYPATFYVPLSISRTCHVRAVMFLGGMLVLEGLDSGFLKQFIGRRFQAAAVVMSVAGMIFAALLSQPNSIPDPLLRPRSEAYVAGCLLLGYSALVIATLTPGTWLNRIFAWRPLCYLGNMSYSFYLIHSLPLHVLGANRIISHLQHSSRWLKMAIFTTSFPIVFVLTGLCSMALFVLVEKRFSLPGPERKTRPAASGPGTA